MGIIIIFFSILLTDDLSSLWIEENVIFTKNGSQNLPKDPTFFKTTTQQILIPPNTATKQARYHWKALSSALQLNELIIYKYTLKHPSTKKYKKEEEKDEALSKKRAQK